MKPIHSTAIALLILIALLLAGCAREDNTAVLAQSPPAIAPSANENRVHIRIPQQNGYRRGVI